MARRDAAGPSGKIPVEEAPEEAIPDDLPVTLLRVAARHARLADVDDPVMALAHLDVVVRVAEGLTMLLAKEDDE